jgi:hypothetical protein
MTADAAETHACGWRLVDKALSIDEVACFVVLACELCCAQAPVLLLFGEIGNETGRVLGCDE